MKNKFIFLLFISIFSFFTLATNVLGNVIDITPSTGLVHIGRWHEVDIIEGMNLRVSITLIEITIDKKIIQSNDHIGITLTPEKGIGSGASKVENVTFNVINERTNKYVIFEQENIPESDHFRIEINPNNFNFSNFEDYQLLISINYTIKNYIDDWWSKIVPILPFKIPLDTDKTVLFGTGCHPEISCPKPKSIYKEIQLPKEIILRSYTEKGSNLGKFGDGRLVIYWKDFTSEEKGNYQNKIIQYTDLDRYNEFVFKQLKIGILLGAILGAIFGWLIQCHFYRKSIKDNKNVNENLMKKFQNELNKLYNKMKSETNYTNQKFQSVMQQLTEFKKILIQKSKKFKK